MIVRLIIDSGVSATPHDVYNRHGESMDPPAPGNAPRRDSTPVHPAHVRWHDRNPLIGAHVPRELKQRLDALSRASGVTRSALIEGALRRLLDEIEIEEGSGLNRGPGEVSP